MIMILICICSVSKLKVGILKKKKKEVVLLFIILLCYLVWFYDDFVCNYNFYDKIKYFL